jgi:hypothetical protein
VLEVATGTMNDIESEVDLIIDLCNNPDVTAKYHTAGGTVKTGMGQTPCETAQKPLLEIPVATTESLINNWSREDEDVARLMNPSDNEGHHIPGLPQTWHFHRPGGPTGSRRTVLPAAPYEQSQNTWQFRRIGIAVSLVALGLVLVVGTSVGMNFTPALQEAKTAKFDSKALHAEELVAARQQVGRVSLALGSAALQAAALSAQCQDGLLTVFGSLYHDLADKVSESCKENEHAPVCKAARSKLQDPEADIMNECKAHGHHCMISVRLPKEHRQSAVCLPGACRKDFARLADEAEKLLQNSATCTSGSCTLDLSCSS